MASQSNSTEKQRWYAVYTKPRWEKKVTSLLQQKGLECYCPLNTVRRKWSDRIKTIQEPLFKSYVFVRVPESKMARVRMTSGVVNFVYWTGKPAIIKEKEIETIKKFLNEYAEVEVEPVNVEIHSKVLIRRGAFMEKQAVVTKLLNRRVQVIIESIGYRITAFIDRTNLELVSTKNNIQSTKKKSCE